VFNTPAGMTSGKTYARFRLSSTQAQAESSVGIATSGEVEDYQVAITGYDYGDAPTGYESNNSARHVIVSGLHLGNVAPDDEVVAQSSANADGDDAVAATNIDDEDGITTFPSLNTNNSSYTLTATVNNTTGSAANVYGWLDFDHDGKFDGDERATVSNGSITLDGNGKVPTGSSGTAILAWNNIGSTGPNITDGNSFIRVRLTTDNLNLTTETTARDDASIGSATNGEVEDYPIAIAPRPELLLVKRITAINPDQPGKEIQFSNFVNDSTVNDNHPLWPNSNVYLRGAIDAGKVEPNDVVEYTVYFLSSGNVNAKEIKICDVIPDQMTFVKNTYGVELGIGLGFDSIVLPTSLISSYLIYSMTIKETFISQALLPQQIYVKK
jgi:uncharacterized repeat protein (TIGR01451 family)